jgi:molybdopterin-guanine dinucleotide biosynthesis protein A
MPVAPGASERDRLAAIVLAGGRSTRYGSDKLQAVVGGRAIRDLAVEAVAAVVAEVVVTVQPDAADPALPSAVAGATVTAVADARRFEGPLAALVAGIGAVSPRRDVVLVVAGDMPSMVPAVLRRLAACLDDPGVDAAILGSEGRRALLPLAIRREIAAAVAPELFARGERRLGALPDAVRLTALPPAEWRKDDPAGDTLVDVDEPGDLSRASIPPL